MSALIPGLSIAPMIDWSNTYFRQFMRILSTGACLYTEMVTPGAIHNQPDKVLAFAPQEHPIALQLGGSDSDVLVQCARQAQQFGYDEVNLNVGCPSDRVLSGSFGACLMAKPDVVAAAVAAMKAALSIPVTVKTRIGIDHFDSYAFFSDFIRQQVEAGVDKLIIHARKAWLKGLSPKENRTIPPVNYDFVYRIKQLYPNIPFIINGDIKTMDDIQRHLTHVDGVMIGRLACDNPYQIHKIACSLCPEQIPITREQAFLQYIPVVEKGFHRGVPLSVLTKPVMNLCHGLEDAKRWKKQLLQQVQSKSIAKLGTLVQIIHDLENRDHGNMVEILVH